jgi:uncharacterized membrane protein YqjE
LAVDKDGEVGRGVDEKSLADLVTEVSEKASLLVREEIELAKAELEQKLKRLVRGAVVAVGAGFFVLLAIILLVEAAAWAVNAAWGYDHLWAGFLIAAGGLFLLAGLAGLIAIRNFVRGTPPTPEQAIEEARLIRSTIEHPEIQAGALTSGEARK